MAEQRFKVLIIDDEQDYAFILKERLSFQGLDVAVATDGKGGVKLAIEFNPDVVLLDLMMPGMDGFETAERLREVDPSGHMKIIYVTAFGRQPDESQRRIIGKSPYLRKPYETSDLLDAIYKVVGKDG